MTVGRRFSELRRTPGLLLAQKMLRRVPFRPVDVGKLCFLRLDHIPRVRRELLRGPAIVRAATIEDLDGLTRLREQRAIFVDRFQNGDQCAVAEIGDRIVGYEWFADGAYHQETAWGYRIEIPAGFIYAYDAFILPSYRNCGIWLRFKAHLADLMIADGGTGILTFVEFGNVPSLRTHLRFGFKPARDVLVIKICGKLLARETNPPMLESQFADASAVAK
jgi:GNAT superfamily N-acetyltransferase